ncbi:MAG: hypothetical protein ACHBMF_11430 [Chromatiales bacterium]
MPDYALGPHTACLGLAFYEGNLLPARYAGGAFFGQHGSWNRKPRSGYKVIFVPFVDGRPAGAPEDVLTGFVNADGEALGRPVGVAVDRASALLAAPHGPHASPSHSRLILSTHSGFFGRAPDSPYLDIATLSVKIPSR